MVAARSTGRVRFGACLALALSLSFAPGVARADEDRPVRRAFAAGFDLRLGAPVGVLGGAAVGLDLVLQPVGPLVLHVGADTNVATVSVHAELQVNLLTFFTADTWTPFVRGGYTHHRFTRVADDLMDTFAPDARDQIQQLGTDLRFQGVFLHLATVEAGIDCLTEGGFHFQLAVGRVFLLEESGGGNDEETVVFTDYQAWTFEMSIGWVFW